MNCPIIYAWVSTRDQNPEMQIRDLRNYVKSRKLKLIKEYIDYAFGSNNGSINLSKVIRWCKEKRRDSLDR